MIKSLENEFARKKKKTFLLTQCLWFLLKKEIICMLSAEISKELNTKGSWLEIIKRIDSATRLGYLTKTWFDTWRSITYLVPMKSIEMNKFGSLLCHWNSMALHIHYQVNLVISNEKPCSVMAIQHSWVHYRVKILV